MGELELSEVLGAVGAGCCWLLAVVFAVSSFGKLRSRAEFAASVRAMKLLPARAVEPVALAVGLVEALAAVLLVVPATAAVGSAVAFGLLAVFTVAIVVVLRRGTAAACRCFGMSEAAFGVRHVVRNAGLMACAVVGGAVAVTAPGVPAAPMFLLAVGIGVIVALIVTMLDELVELFA